MLCCLDSSLRTFVSVEKIITSVEATTPSVMSVPPVIPVSCLPDCRDHFGFGEKVCARVILRGRMLLRDIYTHNG